jgi:CRP/FNR family cyclic AMP-dependent transcriptional regulator
MPVVNLFRPRKTSPRLERLRHLSLFVNLTPGELQIVDGLLHERDYLEGEVIFDEGEEGQAIYIVAAGDVLICRQGQGEAGRMAQLGSAPAPSSANWRCSTIRRARRRRGRRRLAG